MKKNRWSYCALAISMAICTVFMGCSSKKNLSEKIELNLGSFKEKTDDGYKYINIDKDEKIENARDILAGNLESGTYIYTLDSKLYVRSEDDEYEIQEDNMYSYSMSPAGKYLFYFVKGEYLTPKIKELSNNSSSDLKNKAYISGEFVGWLGDEKLAYYGVDMETKAAGIYVYDVSSEKEELLYQINEGFITYIKSFGDSVIFLIKDFQGNSKLMRLMENGDAFEISTEVEEISDIEVTNQGIFLLGKTKNNVYSLYKFNDHTASRLVYDFPLNLSLEKGLSKDEIGDILFMGSNAGTASEKIYKYNNGAVSIAYDKEGQYEFITIN